MNAIEIKNLSKYYKDFKLDNINLTLPQGCIMGLIGQNGSGKTTIIKAIMDLISKDNGSIEVLGKSNTDNFHITKQDIGVVLDTNGIQDLFNTEKINTIMKETYNNWDENKFKSLLEKFDIPRNKKIYGFSFGMKKKLNIAIALSHHCKLLILDEPTAGLDPVVRDEIIDILMEFTRADDHSVLISSHIVNDLEKLCDYIAFIDKGKVKLCDEKDRILSTYGVINYNNDQTVDIPANAIVFKKDNPYGSKIIVNRNFVSRKFEIFPISIEELFVVMLQDKIR